MSLKGETNNSLYHAEGGAYERTILLSSEGM